MALKQCTGVSIEMWDSWIKDKTIHFDWSYVQYSENNNIYNAQSSR